MHIALVHQVFPPEGEIGGIVRYVMAMARGFVRLGHRVTIVTAGVREQEETWEGTPVHRVAVSRWGTGVGRIGRAFLDGPLLSRRLARRVRAVHARDAIDVVEFTNWRGEALAFSFRPCAPHIVRVSTMWAQTNTVPWRRLLLGLHLGEVWRDLLERLAVRRALRLIVATEAHAAEVRKACGAHLPFAIIPFGTSMRRDVSPAEPDHTGKTRFLFVGRLGFRKGFDVLAQAFALVLKEADLAVSLRVVGSDSEVLPERTSFKESVLRNLSPDTAARIEFAGGVGDDDLAREYAACEVLVAPSRYESFGLMFPEAMEFSKPVIGCSSGGIPEVVVDGETGLLVPPGNVNALADAMVRLARDPALRACLGRAGRERWERKFSEARMCESAVEVYRQTIEAWQQKAARP